MQHKLLFLILTMLLLVLPFTNAVIITLTDDDLILDDYIRKSTPDAVGGDSNALYSGIEDVGSATIERAPLMFNWTNKSTCEVVDWADLIMNVLDATTIQDQHIRFVNATWGIPTWNNFPCGTGEPIADTEFCESDVDDNVTSVSSTGILKFNATSIVNKSLVLDRNNISLLMTGAVNTAGSSDNWIKYTAKDAGGSIPILNISCSDAPSDTTPPTLTVNPPANNTAFNALKLNFTVNADDDTAVTLICELNNESELLDSATVSVNVDTNLTYDSGLSEIQQTNMYNITCFDNDATNNNSITQLLNITLDNVFPTISITSPLNNSIIDKTFDNLTIDALCTDQQAIAFNVSLIDSTGAVTLSIQNNTDGTQILIKNETNIANIPTGKYNLNYTCVDGHTYSDSKVTYVTKDEILNKVYYDTLSGNDLSIQMYASNVPLCDFGSRSAPDREIFWYDFKSCNPDAKGINTYRFTLRDNDGMLRYLKDSRYKSHFITEDNFITFQIDQTAGYKITKAGKNYDVIVTTAETFLDFRNSIGGLNKIQVQQNITITETNYTAIEHFDFTVPEIILNSGTFATVSDVAFNLSQDRRLTMQNSLILTKFSNPTSTEVTGRLTFNNKILFERSVSSVAGLDTVRSINFVLNNITGVAGTNNLTYEIKEDGTGSINISNWMTHIITNMTQRAEYGITSQIAGTTFSSSEFANITSLNVNKEISSRTLLDIVNRLEADAESTVTCLIDSNATSSTYVRTILDADDVASTGVSFIDEEKAGSEVYHINCSNTNGASIVSNWTFIALDLKDLDGNIINANSSSNPATGLAGSLTLTAGNNELLSINNFQVRAGNEVEVIASVHLNSSSGSQIATITINSSNNCLDQHERSFTDDTGTIKFYASCNALGVPTINITLGVAVPTGETVIIADESLTIYEIVSLNTSVANIAPLINIILPIPDAILFDNSRIEWFTSEPNSNNYITNITAVNSSNTNLIFSGLIKDISNVTFNFSALGEGVFTLNVISAENETAERLIGTASSSFTVRFPTISVNLSAPANNSVDIDGVVEFKFITDTGNSNNCSLFIDNTINNVNQSINASVGLNSFEVVTLNNASHTWLVRCDNSSLLGVSGQFNLDVLIPDANELNLLVCPNTTSGMLTLLMIAIIAIIFIAMGFGFNVGIVGMFGAIMLMISSWFISPCSNVFAYAIALLAGILLILFIARGFFKREE